MQRLTAEPAAFFGIHDRGRLVPSLPAETLSEAVHPHRHTTNQAVMTASGTPPCNAKLHVPGAATPRVTDGTLIRSTTRANVVRAIVQADTESLN